MCVLFFIENISLHGNIHHVLGPDEYFFSTHSIGIYSASSRRQVGTNLTYFYEAGTNFTYYYAADRGFLGASFQLIADIPYAGGWTPASSDIKPYLQLNLGAHYVVTGVVTQGTPVSLMYSS